MLEGGKISNRQAVFIIFTAIVPTSILILPHLMYKIARQDVWLSVIVATLYGLAVGDIIGRLGKRFPGQTVVEYSRDLLGPILGTGIALLYPVLFTYANAFILRQLSEMLVANFYNETPQVVFVIGFLLVAVYMVRHGLEVLGRFNDTILLLVLISIVILLLFIIPYIMPENIFPVLEKGIQPVLKGAYPASLFFGETFIMLVLVPYLTRPDKARSVNAKAILMVGGTQFLIMLFLILIFDALLANILYPTLNLARQIRLQPYLYNVDIFILFMWLLGGTVKIAIFHYCATLSTAQLFKLKHYGPVSIVLGAVTGILSAVLWEDAVELLHGISTIAPPTYFIVQVAVPLFLLTVAVIRHKGEPGNAGR